MGKKSSKEAFIGSVLTSLKLVNQGIKNSITAKTKEVTIFKFTV